MSSTLPVIMTLAGAQPTPLSQLRAELIAIAVASDPGLTTDLPGSLIEDVTSTQVAGLSVIDQARVDSINNVTPYGCNAFVLNQLGQVYGVQQGVGSNTSVNVVFAGPPGFVISVGFVVSDGSFQYVIQDGGIINSTGFSQPLFAIATQSGSWPVPIDTVNQIVTSVPSTIALSVNNPQAGTMSVGAQTEQDYRGQVLQAGLASAQGMARFLKTQLQNVVGVQSRLVSVLQAAGGPAQGYEIIVGGGDPYDVAYAIFEGVFWIPGLIGSTLTLSNISTASLGVATTGLNHGYTTGQAVTFENVAGMTQVNGNTYTATVIDEKNFTFGVSTLTGYGVYTGGGYVLPNFRNEVVSINDYPDVYTIPFVVPPQQTVAVSITWNTNSTNFVSGDLIAQLGSPAVVNYINSIAVGAPINLLQLETAFAAAIATTLPPQFLTRLVVGITINGVATPTLTGENIIVGDIESYFQTASTEVSINQG